MEQSSPEGPPKHRFQPGNEEYKDLDNYDFLAETSLMQSTAKK